MTTPFTPREIHFAGETFVNVRRGRWNAGDKAFVTHTNVDGTWWCGSSPKLEFNDVSCEVEGYLYEDAALRAAIIRHYEIQVKVCESELHKHKKILFEARGH